jgi:putative membrane protein
MKTKPVISQPVSILTVCGLCLLALPGMAEEKRSVLNSADEKFVKQEASAGMAVVKVAALAVKKTGRNDIKAFAEMLVTDHTKANSELTKLAESKGVEISKEMDPKHAESYQSLEKLDGADFDKEFLDQIVSVHKKCVRNFEEAARDAKDADLKAWAGKMAPVLKAHLEKAQELDGKAVASPTTPEPANTTRPAQNPKVINN